MTEQLVLRSNRVSDKSYATAVILSMIFGVLGVHHIYLRRWDEAVLDLGLTMTAMYFLHVANDPLIGWSIMALDILHTIIVTSMLVVGKFCDGSGKVVAYPGQFPTPESLEQLPTGSHD